MSETAIRFTMIPTYTIVDEASIQPLATPPADSWQQAMHGASYMAEVSKQARANPNVDQDWVNAFLDALSRGDSEVFKFY